MGLKILWREDSKGINRSWMILVLSMSQFTNDDVYHFQ